jgi:hypothetical protein
MPRKAAVLVAGSLVVLDLSVSVLLALAAVQPSPTIAASVQATPQSQQASFEVRARAIYHAPSTARTFSAYMSSITFSSEGRPANSAVKAGHAVWLVTVYSDNGACEDCTLERSRRLHHVYSVVYDATTGRVVDSCGGCEWVKVSRPETASEHLVAGSPSWLQSTVIRLLFARA